MSSTRSQNQGKLRLIFGIWIFPLNKAVCMLCDSMPDDYVHIIIISSQERFHIYEI